MPTATWSTCASADGALMIAVPADGLRNGFAYGLSWDYPSRIQAESNAKSECMKTAKENDVDPQRCRLIETFKGKCGAIAMDPVIFTRAAFVAL